MKIQPLGVDGVKDRVREIEARMRQVFGEQLARASRSNGTGGSTLLAETAATTGYIQPLGVFSQGVDGEALPQLAQQIAEEAGVDPALFAALVQAESGWNPRALSPKGAAGLTQLMPGTAKSLGVADSFDPIQNLRGGAKYLKRMMDEFKDPSLALAAYNAGPGAVRRYGGVPPYRETQNYVRKILGDNAR